MSDDRRLVSEDELARCADEPIHIPGAIQPHGVLVALREPELSVTQVSANIGAMLGRPAAEALDRPLPHLLGQAAAARVAAALAQEPLAEANPLRLDLDGGSFDGIVHRHDGVTILELEPRQPLPRPAELMLGRALRRLQATRGIEELQAVAVAEIRALTGYDRVMLYQFDPDGHGKVAAESKADDLEPFLGLHYPASDIPAQARELYRRNWLRIIPDASYTPAPLEPPLRPDTGQPLDLSHAVLRSVSPVHREYLRNFGMQASMSISLLRGDALWGLVTCVNRTPRIVPYELRAACEAIGQLLSLQISAFEELAERRQWTARQPALRRLQTAMQDPQRDVLSALLQQPDALLDAVEAAGAAVVNGDALRSVGTCPPPEALSSLAAWVSQAMPEDGVLQTHRLPSEFPPAAAFAATGAGLLAIASPTPGRRLLLWFRPEEEQTVHWGGDPNQAAAVDPHSRRLHPRRSFELWKEVVRGQARRWQPVDLQVAAELRRSAIEADLARQVLREQAAVRARDDLVAVVSHDLRNPMAVVVMQSALMRKTLADAAGDASRRLQAAAERIHSAAERMANLLNDLVDLSKIEAGRFAVSPRPQNPAELLEDTTELMQPVAQAKSIRLTWSSATRDPVLADPERIFQVLGNLIGNAIKFTPEHGSVSLTAHRTDDAVEVAVSDSGPGIPPEQQARLFDRYWQARQGHAKGAGLGLFIARGIVEAHGGRIWVESTPGVGSSFRFTLPRADPAE